MAFSCSIHSKLVCTSILSYRSCLILKMVIYHGQVDAYNDSEAETDDASTTFELSGFVL